MNKERFENLVALRQSEALTVAYTLDLFGFELAKRHGYKNIDGRDAVHLYLINKHHWLPRDVRSMSDADIELALTEELQDWNWPKDARAAEESARTRR